MKPHLTFILLLAILLVGMCPSNASGQSAYVTVPVPHASVPNKIISFYAGGESEGYTIRASPQGGSLSIGGYGVTNFMPWAYVTVKWSTGTVYIIFLVNVTQTDFRIGFLYLTNSSDQPFILRWFDYNGGKDPGINNWTFQGTQHVTNRTVSTASVTLPKLQIPLSTSLINGISVLGPQLYLTSDGGQLLNETGLLKIYPVLNQLYGGPKEYNEVWSLLADSAGNYYFAILYMQNNDSSHVIIEHQLRLNDYRKLDSMTLNAKWIKGEFANQVTVRTKMPNLTVKIDGFPFQTNLNGIASTGVPYGTVTIEVPNEIPESPTSKLRFAAWDRYGTSNPLTILVNSTLDTTVTYNHTYPIYVASPFGSPAGSGWFTQGTNVTFSVQNEINYGNRTRRVFTRWDGDSNSTSNKAWLIVNSPKQVKASWTTQYAVTFTTAGLPANASALAIIGNQPVTLNGSQPYTRWVNANQQLPIQIQSTQIHGSISNYYFSRVAVDNQTVPGALNVKKPLTVSIIYITNPKMDSTINLQVYPTITSTGYPLSITGAVAAASEPTFVDLLYNSANSSWQTLARIPVTHNGAFTYTWKADKPGDYSLKAYWQGDSSHPPASKIVSVRVLDSSNLLGGAGGIANYLRSIISTVKSIPQLSPFIDLASKMMTLGLVLAPVFFPGGSLPIVGDLIGSLFIGLVYVFPIAVIIAFLKTMRTRRVPKFGWVMLLLGLWLSSFAVTLLSPRILLLQPFAAVSQIILLTSTTLLPPILAAVLLARAFA
jgi:hypothetical protein